MLTSCNDIVSNVCKLAMSHCGSNVAYKRYVHNIDLNRIFSHNSALIAQIYALEQQGLIIYYLVDARKGIQYIDNYYNAMSECMTHCATYVFNNGFVKFSLVFYNYFCVVYYMY